MPCKATRCRGAVREADRLHHSMLLLLHSSYPYNSSAPLGMSCVCMLSQHDMLHTLWDILLSDTQACKKKILIRVRTVNQEPPQSIEIAATIALNSGKGFPFPPAAYINSMAQS